MSLEIIEKLPNSDIRVIQKKQTTSMTGRFYLCKCHCGESVVASKKAIRILKSCGCKLRGVHKEIEYKSYTAMKSRCSDINHHAYSKYGGRGITVCERWLDKDNGYRWFIEDMGRRPSLEYSIDRIDNNKGYSPENCRWATSTQQNRNSRNIHTLEYNGKTVTISEWSELTGISISAISSRLSRGWTIEQALTIPVNFRNRLRPYKRKMSQL